MEKTKELNFEESAYKWLCDNQLAYDIWTKKYRYNNESFEDWLNRVCNRNESVKRMIMEKKFLFGGRILANRGLQNKQFPD